MARKGYTQLQDTETRQIWLRMVAKSMGLDHEQHKDRVRIYDFALAALAAQLTGAELRSPMANTVDIEAKAKGLSDPEPWERDLGHYEYLGSQKVYCHTARAGFIATLAALMRDADTDNFARLAREFPVIATMLKQRYNADAGVLSKVDGYTAQEYIDRQAALEEEKEPPKDAGPIPYQGPRRFA